MAPNYKYPASTLFLEVEGSVQTILGNPSAGEVKIGFHNSTDSLLSNLDVSTYMSKDADGSKSVSFKIEFDTIGGNSLEYKLKTTLSGDLVDGVRSPSTTFESDMLLLYDVLTGRKTNISVADKGILSNFISTNINALASQDSNISLSDVNVLTQSLINNVSSSSERPVFDGNHLSNSGLYGILVDAMKDTMADKMGVTS